MQLVRRINVLTGLKVNNIRVINVEEERMGFTEKIAGAKETSWISEGFSESEQKTIVELAKISARIERRRIEMGMTQKEFAEYMGVSQGMISKWESREYNFTIKTLNEICQKIGLDLSISLDRPCIKANYTITKWDMEKTIDIKGKKYVVGNISNEEAIA